ncbi:MAG: hypothetical protein Q4P36_02225 [Bowdeniella nasicola]|nr:hypothetical protein [Bowdeniella nasicola]
MRRVSALVDFSRTEHETLWLSTAGWYATRLQRIPGPARRIALIGQAPHDSDLDLRIAMDALNATALHVSSPGPREAPLSELAEVSDLAIVWGRHAPQNCPLPVLSAGGDAGEPALTLAMVVTHILAGGSLDGAHVDLRGLPAGVQISLTELALDFALTLHVGEDHPSPSLLDELAAEGMAGSVSTGPAAGEGQRLTTAEPSLAWRAAAWCALLSTLAA